MSLTIKPQRFAAIDFETADYSKDSACSLAIVRVEKDQIVSRWHRLIRPPRQNFVFSYLHGITWNMVRDQPTFGELWPEISEQLADVSFLVAHNSGFDKAVMATCCCNAQVREPIIPYECTVQIARATWNIFPTKLPDVCRHLNIDLIHHQADSDAEACAKIYIASERVTKPARKLKTKKPN